MTNGSEMTRPDFRPLTSNVTRELAAMPDEATAAHALFSILANRLGRRPRYSHRCKSPRAIPTAVPSSNYYMSSRLPPFVTWVEHEGARYLVTMPGEELQWVKNMRAAASHYPHIPDRVSSLASDLTRQPLHRRRRAHPGA